MMDEMGKTWVLQRHIPGESHFGLGYHLVRKWLFMLRTKRWESTSKIEWEQEFLKQKKRRVSSCGRGKNLSCWSNWSWGVGARRERGKQGEVSMCRPMNSGHLNFGILRCLDSNLSFYFYLWYWTSHLISLWVSFDCIEIIYWAN